MLNNEEQNRSDQLWSRAYDMFPCKHKPYEYLDRNLEAFPMYSYERVSNVFWGAFIDKLVSKRLSDDQVEWLLRSKEMRWMLDSTDAIEKLAHELVTDSMIETAKMESE